MNLEKKQHIFWLDLVRVISIFFVVVIHVASPIYTDWKELPRSDWMAGIIYNSIARVSVPLLFMVSGYLLLSRQEDIRSFYLNRVRKVIFPLMVWSVIYLMWQNGGYANFTFFNALKAMTYEILKGPANYHLWFVYTLLEIYLFVPALRSFVRFADETTLWYLAGIWLAFGPALDYLEHSYLNFDTAVDLKFFSQYFGYFYLGYVLGRLNVSRRAAAFAGLSYVFLTIYTIVATYRWSEVRQGYLDYYHNYLRLNIVLMTISIFFWLKYVGENLGARLNIRALGWARGLSTSTFGIYLVHALALTIIRKGVLGFQLTELSGSPYVMIPVLAALVFIVSYLVIAILQRIPYLRAIVSG
jgi:surface polysaccharide O-acyltransferase-like enzyme